jgi:Tfp pilus assembly protein PilF
MSNSGTLSLAAVLQQALASHKAGQLAAAEKAYQAVLSMDPAHAGANHNFGVLMVQSGRFEKGLVHLERALEAGPGEALYYFSFAKGLLAAGRPAEAGAVLRQAAQMGLADKRFDKLRLEVRAAAVQSYRASLAERPDDAVLLDNLGSALLEQGKVDEAISCYQRALAAAPDFAEAHYHLGAVLSDNGRVAEGFAHYMRRAALVYGKGKAPPKDEPDPAHKVKHDLEQRDYLAGGKASPDAPLVPDMFHLADGSRVEGPAVNPANATPELVAEWHRARPQLVMMDDFLTRPALEKLRAYCAGSTVWRKIYTAGYLGAAPEDGFACPLLAQIVEEIQSNFYPILGEEKFRYLGAFKYDSENCAGTNTHADNSIVNVNFYITPDEANLDPESGGMEIWDIAPPDVETMRRLNGNEELARDFIKRSGAKRGVIPHRANRAVIFKSTQFHKTDTFRFKSGYLCRRINISLLFGRFD